MIAGSSPAMTLECVNSSGTHSGGKPPNERDWITGRTSHSVQGARAPDPEIFMSEDAGGIRAGEVAGNLPERFDASVYFIGHIRTPWTVREECPKNARESAAVCTIVVDPRWKDALFGIETCTHLLVLYWMDKARRDLVLQVPRHLGEPRGTFALRSPVRPNPIAASVVRLARVDGCRLAVVGLD